MKLLECGDSGYAHSASATRTRMREHCRAAIAAFTKLTVQLCQTTCASQGFGVFGVENGNECWCADGIKNSGAPQPARKCTTPCNGDSSQLCGGGWALDVYSTTTATRNCDADSNCSGDFGIQMG